MAAVQIARIRKQIAKLVKQEERIRKSAIKGVVAQIRKLMDEHDIALGDLRTGKRGRPGRKPGRKPGRPAKVAVKKAAKPARKTTVKVKPKYRSPDKKSTWSGRGRAPVWARAWVDSGKKIDDLLIKK